MKLIRYDYPEASIGSNDFGRWLRDTLRDFGDPFPAWASVAGRNTLPLDLYENGDAFHAVVDLPGLSREKIQVELENSILQISASTGESEGEPTERFSRSVSVPDGIDPGKVTARFEDGVLTVTLPKHEHQRPRVVSIA
jgi:HSP20 family protein